MSIMVVLYIFCLPKELFTKPTSTVIVSKEGELLGALIAKDGQWRFPQNDEVPEKFEKCVTNFEDEYFYWHPGFNPISIGKALWQNYKAKEVVRGGSTITQQVIRLSRNGTPRTYFEKIKELVLARNPCGGTTSHKIVTNQLTSSKYQHLQYEHNSQVMT